MIVLLAPAALAADDVAGHVSQAKFFLKKSWYADAAKELEAAAALPDGAIDPEVWYLLATVRYALLDVAGASDAAERAQTYARTDDQLYQAASYAQFLREQFGVVEVLPPYPGFVGRLRVAPATPPLDPELRAYLARLGARYDKRATFPVVVSLPVGEYDLNGAPVAIEPGATVTAARTAAQLGGSGLASAQLARVELGVGLSTWIGPQVRNLEPAPALHGAVSQPVGGLVAGVFADWAPRWYDTRDGQIRFSSDGWGVGARLGWELTGTGAVAIRPSVGYRVSQLAGLERSCLDEGGGFVCRDDGPAELVIYGTGLGHSVLGELSVDYLDRTRKRTVGIGVKVVGEQTFGRLPASGVARSPDDAAFDYVLADDARGFSATGVRFMPNFSIAL